MNVHSGVIAAFRMTWRLLAFAVVAIAPLGFLTFRDLIADVAPLCTGGSIGDEAPERFVSLSKSDLEKLPERRFDEEKDGSFFHLDTTQVPWAGGRDMVTWGRIRRVGRDPSGESCNCGDVVLRPACVSAHGGTMRQHDDGAYSYVDALHGWCGAFRVVDVPTRHFQRDRLLERKNIPALISLGAVVALVIAGFRVRRGVSYARKFSAWTEATVHPGGRVESSTGDMLGIVEHQRSGTVLVDPNAAKQGQGVYRDVPILSKRAFVVGSHAEWQRVTARRLRDARALAIVSVVCTMLGVLARALAA